MELKPAQLTVHEGGQADGTLTLLLSYPDMPTNDDGQSPFKERIPSGYLLRHQLDLVVTDEASPYAFWLGPPLVEGDITVEQDGQPVVESPMVTQRVYPRTFVTSRAEDGTEVFHTVQTWPATEVSIPLRLNQGSVVTIRDAYGNFAEWMSD